MFTTQKVSACSCSIACSNYKGQQYQNKSCIKSNLGDQNLDYITKIR